MATEYTVVYHSTDPTRSSGTTLVTLIDGRTTFADIPKIVARKRGTTPDKIDILAAIKNDPNVHETLLDFLPTRISHKIANGDTRGFKTEY